MEKGKCAISKTMIFFLLVTFLGMMPVLQQAASAATYDAVVAKDGSGGFTTITAAYNSLPIPTSESGRKTIYVKNGTYKEQLVINKPYISIVGESRTGTKLTYNAANGDTKPSGGTYGSADCAALTVAAKDFHASNITFENTHLKDTGKDTQASCVYTYGDRLTFTNCGFYSGQDTLCAYSYGVDKSRVYFKDCFIQGSVDFIWGGAAAVFDGCTLNELRTGGAYTAANTPQGQQFGYVFLNCTLTAMQDTNYTFLTNPAWGTPTTVYLGRTYGDYCHVTFISCALNAPVNALGWQTMSNNNLNYTAKLEEYGCTGAGSNRSGRVSWSQALTASQAASYTVSNVLKGSDGWNPAQASTPTPTPTPGTATPTPTPGTVTPTPTPSTATSTPTPSSSASTPTPTPTPATGTPVPGGIKVQFFNGNTAASTNTIYPNFKLVNTGTAAVNLSDVKMRYYFTNDGSQADSYACDYATAGAGNVTGSFATIAKTNADRYLEIGFTSAAGTLAAGAGTEVKGRVWKSDWSSFTQTNDYSFNATATNYVDAATTTGYIAGSLNWGTEP